MPYGAQNVVYECYDASKNPMGKPHHPVIVNLRVNIDLSGNVELFGASEEEVCNIIVPTLKLDVSGLFADESQCLIEFWEPSGARGTMLARVDNEGNGTKAKETSVAFAKSLAKVLRGAMDASAAAPFGSYAGFTSYENFGELVLSYAAEGMFGHPQATSAITNDVNIVNAFQNDSLSNAYTGAAAPVPTKSNTEALADRAIAAQLAWALLNLDNATALKIAQQVIGQDAGRATREDNSARSPDDKQSLRFYKDDVVYVAVTLKNFTHTMGAGFPASANGQQYLPVVPPTQKYYLRLTLQ